MVVTDALVDLRALKATDGAGGKTKNKRKRRDNRKLEHKSSYKGKGKASVGDTSKHKTSGFFICDGLH